jgi:hypothetical protein
VKVTDSGKETFEAWREGDHDDLVMAVALAARAGERVHTGSMRSARCGQRRPARLCFHSHADPTSRPFDAFGR